MDVKFFIERPKDSHGNTSMRQAVVEVRVEIRNGRDVLVPIAPRCFALVCPSGWPKSSAGGWVEAEGPARFLSVEEHKELVAMLADASQGPGEIEHVTLRTGAEIALSLAIEVMKTLEMLVLTDYKSFRELAMVCRDASHGLAEQHLRTLQQLGMLQSSGRPHEAVRQVVLAAVRDEGSQILLENPVDA